MNVPFILLVGVASTQTQTQLVSTTWSLPYIGAKMLETSGGRF